LPHRANVIDPHYRALVLLATWAGLRFRRAAALRRGDIDLASGSVRIERQLEELKSGELQEGAVSEDRLTATYLGERHGA